MKTRARYQHAVECANLDHHLRFWPWMLAGTPPLAIDIPSSDIDVVCTVNDRCKFAKALWQAYGNCQQFLLWQWCGSGRPVIARFLIEGWEFEVFGGPSPLDRHIAVRHFAVERRLLALSDERLRDAVRTQKLAGRKTEPAFAALLGLSGDPYQALLDLELLPDDDLARLLSNAGFAAVTHGHT